MDANTSTGPSKGHQESSSRAGPAERRSNALRALRPAGLKPLIAETPFA